MTVQRRNRRGLCAQCLKMFTLADDDTVLQHAGTKSQVCPGSGAAPAPALTSEQTMTLAQITYRQLDHWTRRGYLTPLGLSEPGSGNSRFWALSEVVTAATMGRLINAGFLLQVAARLARGETGGGQ